MDKHKDLRDKFQIVMTKGLGQNIPTMAGLVGCSQ